jgi:hypothetical protein
MADANATTLFVTTTVPPNGKLVLDVPERFKGEPIKVEYKVTKAERRPKTPEEWRKFLDEVTIDNESFVAPPDFEMPPAPNFDE